MSAVLSLTPSYYEALKQLTLELAGVKLGTDHAFLIETRLSSLARTEGFDTLKEMIEELFKTGQSRLAVQVVSSLLERDTHFNTDLPSFNKLYDVIIPQLQPIHKNGTIRILSFGCSSGQEPYSIAMALDKTKEEYPNLNFEIVGVDYPSSALDRAKVGRYSHFDVQRGLPIQDLITYFNKENEDWTIKPDLRNKVTFEETHLLSNLDQLGDFHVVLFRNSLPHYSSPAQVRVLRGLSGLVKPLGYLLLGSGETLNHINFGFDPITHEDSIFRKRPEKIEAEPIDPNIKVPNGKKTFDKAKRKLRGIDEFTNAKPSQTQTG